MIAPCRRPLEWSARLTDRGRCLSRGGRRRSGHRDGERWRKRARCSRRSPLPDAAAVGRGRPGGHRACHCRGTGVTRVDRRGRQPGGRRAVPAAPEPGVDAAGRLPRGVPPAATATSAASRCSSCWTPGSASGAVGSSRRAGAGQWPRRRAWRTGGPTTLRSLVATAIRDGGGEVVLDERLIERLTSWAPEAGRLPPSVELSVFVAARKPRRRRPRATTCWWWARTSARRQPGGGSAGSRT